MEYFLKDCAKRHMRNQPEIAPELMDFFKAYDWPGNVRQLRNAIENMLVMGHRERLTKDDLPRSLSGNPSIPTKPVNPDSLILNELEREAILSALERSYGNRTHAAHTLGISVRTLQRKLKQWGWNSRRANGCDTPNALNR